MSKRENFFIKGYGQLEIQPATEKEFMSDVVWQLGKN
jgi:hypothetical protein